MNDKGCDARRASSICQLRADLFLFGKWKIVFFFVCLLAIDVRKLIELIRMKSETTYFLRRVVFHRIDVT